jgi:hypothetical protein
MNATNYRKPNAFSGKESYRGVFDAAVGSVALKQCLQSIYCERLCVQISKTINTHSQQVASLIKVETAGMQIPIK